MFAWECISQSKTGIQHGHLPFDEITVPLTQASPGLKPLIGVFDDELSFQPVQAVRLLDTRQAGAVLP